MPNWIKSQGNWKELVQEADGGQGRRKHKFSYSSEGLSPASGWVNNFVIPTLLAYNPFAT